MITECAICCPSALDTVLGFTRTALHVVTSSKKGASHTQLHCNASGQVFD